MQHGAILIVQFEYGGTYIDARVFLKDIWEFMAGINPALFKLHPAGPRRVRGTSRSRNSVLGWVLARDVKLDVVRTGPTASLPAR
jgi:hypothetical protein